MHIEDLITEIEAIFEGATREQVEKELERKLWDIEHYTKELERAKEKAARCKKWAKWEVKTIRSIIKNNPRMIADLTLTARAVKEGIAYRWA